MAKRALRCFACESPLRASFLYCPLCGVRLDSGVAGHADDGLVEPTTIYAREQPRLFGVPPQDTLLVLGIAVLLLAFAVFATGHLIAGIVLLVSAYVFLGAFVEAMRRRPASIVARRTLAGIRALRRDVEFVAVAVPASVTTRAKRVRLWHERRSLARAQRASLLELGTAVHAGDEAAAASTGEALADLDITMATIDAEVARLERRRAQRIRAARIARAGRASAERPTVIGTDV